MEGLTGLLGNATTQAANDETVEKGRTLAETFNWIRGLRCPSIAAVHGYAYGAGLHLALACDLRIFGESATVAVADTRYGLLPDMGATIWLPRIVGDGHARQLILLGEEIGAGEAYRIGLANLVVPDANLAAAAADLAARLAAQPPVALAGARRALASAWEEPTSEAFRIAVREQIKCLQSDDFQEGLKAFTEGRPPVWTGR